MLFTALTLGVLLGGCQGSMLNIQGQSIQYPDRITLSERGQQSDQYRTEDLVVDYQYDRTGDNLKASGVIRFSTSMQGNFTTVSNFSFAVVLADAEGKVLIQQGLITANAQNIGEPINFSKTMAIPPQTKLMAFSYTGQVSGAGTAGSPTSFWHDPVAR
jgi:hypothetical protein